MNKTTILFGCLLAIAPAMAQPGVREMQDKAELSLRSLEPIAKCTNLPRQKAKLPETPVYNPPQGEKVYYERTAYGYYYDWDTFTFGRRLGGIAIIYGEDDYAFIHNPISGWATETYMVGQVNDEGIEVSLPQLIDIEPDYENPGDNIYLYAAVMKQTDATANYVTYEVVEENVTFFMDAEGNLSYNLSENQENPGAELIIGLCDDRGNLYYGDAAQYLNKVELSQVTPPADLEYDDWKFFANGDDHRVQLGFDGSDVYLRNFDFIYARNTWIKGTISGDYITFNSGQFLEETNGYFYHFLAAVNNGYVFEIQPEITFLYDKTKNLMTAQDDAYMISNPFINKISNEYPEFMSYYIPALKELTAEPTSFVPQNPEFVAYIDETSWAGCNFCQFNLYDISVDYDPIDPSQLSFILFFNGDSLDNFTDKDGSITFPYGFWGEDPNFISIFQLGTNLVMYTYFEGCESIGMQLLNTTPDGVEYLSDLVTYHIDTDTVTVDSQTAVAKVATDNIISSECFDINGMKCGFDTKGLHIIVERHSDGTITSRKVMVK